MPASALGLPSELALAFLAGVLLNLTPCVLPVIPLKIRTIIHHAGASPRQRVEAAVAFLAGTLLFFLAIGSASALLHWTWGVLFQSPAVIAFLVALMAGFAAMIFFDIDMPVPAFAYRMGGGRHMEPLISGVLAAILSTPCTGPFLGGVLAFALTQAPAVLVTLFLAIGLGLAFPYVVILLRPSLLDRLPKVGEWSRRLRQALAFLLLAGAVFFAGSLLSTHVTLWLWRAWAVGLAVWAGVAIVRRGTLAVRIVAISAAALGLSTAFAGGLLMPPHGGPLHWRPFTKAQLVAARRAHRPVLVEFTAAWCINCKILEKTVYVAPSVVRAAQHENLVALRVDLTRPNPALERLLVKDGGAGLPFAEIRNPEGHITEIFRGLFGPAALAAAIDRSASRLDMTG
ncbi:protein-disulfide reductase DsbD [Acidiphilium sp.]|nr:cytochrome c biogenesis protein CcdA [Acidiphilium sp.]